MQRLADLIYAFAQTEIALLSVECDQQEKYTPDIVGKYLLSRNYQIRLSLLV
jgi:hypothetical protein